MKADRIVELNMEELLPKMAWVNLVLLAAAAISYHFFVEPLAFRLSWSGILYFAIGYVVLIAIHELFHLLGFLVFGRAPLSSLKWGVNLELGIAYATTDRPIQNRPMRKALLLPFWMTAALPAVIGFWISDQVLVLLAAMLAAGAYGDFRMWQALRREPDDVWVVDDAELPRLHLYDEFPEQEKAVPES